MITVVTTELPADQLVELQRWAQDRAGVMFRDLILANIAFHQAEAGKNLLQSVADGTQEARTADEAAEQGARYCHALAVFDDIVAGGVGAIRTTVSMFPPPKIEIPTT